MERASQPRILAAANDLDSGQQLLLNLLQTAIPVVARPYRELGAQAGLAEQAVIDLLRRLRAEGIIRQVGAIFDSRALGYDSSLVAARIDPDRIDAAAAIINRHPGVSHNYRRDHAYNLWYTLAVAPTSRLGLARTVERLHQLSGAMTTRLLPALRVFKIGVHLDMTGESPPEQRGADTPFAAVQPPLPPLCEQEIGVVRELQRDLPDTPEPFAEACARLDITIEELAAATARMRAAGRLRRIAAVLNHRRAGFGANAMGVWQAPPERVEDAGAQMASFRAVSHCYQRPTYPDWPYNLFTMVHGHARPECEATLAAIRQATGLPAPLALYSTREYKKARISYFSPEAERWEREQPLAPAP